VTTAGIIPDIALRLSWEQGGKGAAYRVVLRAARRAAIPSASVTDSLYTSGNINSALFDRRLCRIAHMDVYQKIQLIEYSSILFFHGYNTHASTHGNAIIIFSVNKD
jgi:hypothetical protein